MRIWSLMAAVIFSLLSVNVAAGEEKNPLLEGAQKFCATKYGNRLLGVTLEGESGFSCRFAAVTRTESFRLAPQKQQSKSPENNAQQAKPQQGGAQQAKSQPAWDLDEEDESTASLASAGSTAPGSSATENLSTAALAPALVKLAPQTKPAAVKKKTASKRRYKKRRYKKRRYRRRNRDPFAALIRNIRKASPRRKAKRRYVRRYRTNVRRRRR